MLPAEPKDHLESLTDELSHALGRAIWAFSVVETATFDYLRQLSREPLHELMVDQLFKARLGLAMKLVRRIDGFVAEKAKAELLLSKAEELAKTRNAIAHNPWQIWVDYELRDFQANIQPPRPNAKPHTLASIRQFTNEAQEVAGGMFEALRSLPHVCNLP